MMKKIVYLLLLVIVITGCSAQYSKMASRDIAALPKPESSPALAVDIWLDCETNKLGAYTVELNYDPRIISVSDIKTASDGGFPGAPMANPATYATGKTVIIGMYTGNDLPDKKIKIAHITFKPLISGTSPLAVSIQNTYDTDGKPLPASAILSQETITVP